MDYNIISQDNIATVVAEYSPEYRVNTAYQSEAALEKEFIELLAGKDGQGGQGYTYIHVSDEAAMITNLRKQLELLNDYTFTDSEWDRFFLSSISGVNDNIVTKTRRMQEDHVQILIRDDGTSKNIKLIDKKDIHNNQLQVLNQYEETGGTRKTRYDVTILVNGLPLIHVELKRRGVAIREAFNQINRYQRDSFWASTGLYQYVQIFVISNGTHTKYYSNTTREQRIKETSKSSKRTKKTSNSFEFTSSWADANNNVISDLVDFTKTFFSKHTILRILTRYCVFTAEDLLLVMRPYQIAATEQILQRIESSTNYKKTGTIEAGGFIWHTTGSGKTLTSFKTAQLATSLPYIDKVLFVVDRKDLDYQTMKEYDRFAKGSANSSTNSTILTEQLTKPNGAPLKTGQTNQPIIVTTIQKLDVFIRRHKKHDIFGKHIVIIFDECHRSQFGDMHRRIIKHFKQYHLFGFTGTPIFPSNAPTGTKSLIRTTAQAFGEKLHTYTIVNAINDNNVLPFQIDYFNTIKMSDNVQDTKIRAIDWDKALSAPERVSKVTTYILDHFDQKTKRNNAYARYDYHAIENVMAVATVKPHAVAEKKVARKVTGFNSIFAVASIPLAMQYYNEFKTQINESGKQLRIATIFSYTQNEAHPDEDFDNDKLDKVFRDFLDAAIKDYNDMFGVEYSTSGDKFQNYYKDISLRVKNREIDLLIVVNMFLTGFDATTLNTLWVDKNLQHHGLLQAFSRTNRILNSVKTYGNIICFRDLKQATDEAIALFGDKEAGGIVLLKTYEDYYNGFEENGKYTKGYKELIELITDSFPLGGTIIGESEQNSFVRLFGAILRSQNILTSFDDFSGNEILSEREFQDYMSIYLDLHDEFRKKGVADKEDITDDLIFEIELVKQIEVTIDYILMLVRKYHETNCTDKTILSDIQKSVNASIELRSKKDLIEAFLARINLSTTVDEDWISFVQAQRDADLAHLIETEQLKPIETRQFMNNAFRDGMLKTTGTGIDKILPPVSRFRKDGSRVMKKQTVIEKLTAFFEKFSGLV